MVVLYCVYINAHVQSSVGDLPVLCPCIIGAVRAVCTDRGNAFFRLLQIDVGRVGGR